MGRYGAPATTSRTAATPQRRRRDLTLLALVALTATLLPMGMGPASAATGDISTYAGGGAGDDGGAATDARLDQPQGVTVDGTGNLYIADPGNSRVRRVTPSGTITTVAGNGTQGYSGDDGPATDASLSRPGAVALDSAGDLYIADLANNRVRRVTPAGTITTVAGNGTRGFSGDGGPATNASLSGPSGLAVDGADNLYIADPGNHRVRRVTPAGIITTVAGNGMQGYSGDGVPAIIASLYYPGGVAVDGAGNLYIADTVNDRVRRVTPSGIITTVAGKGTRGYSGDGGRAILASLCYPMGVTVDGAGALFIADGCNSRARRVTPAGTITTVAGNGIWGFSGDGGPAINASLYFPSHVAVDSAGDLYIADMYNHRVRRVEGVSAGPSDPGTGPGPTPLDYVVATVERALTPQ